MYGEKRPEDITTIDAERDLGIWRSPNMSFSLHLEKSAQKAFAVLRMIQRASSRITRTDFQVLYGAYVRPLLEYANPVVYSGRTNHLIFIERLRRVATEMVSGLKSMDYETRLAVLDFFPLDYRRPREDLILAYALFEQGLANRFFTADPENTRRGHGIRRSTDDSARLLPHYSHGLPSTLWGLCQTAPVVYSGRTNHLIFIERLRRVATEMVSGLKSMDYETRLAVLDFFPLDYRRPREDLILAYALFEQGLANRFFTADPENTRRGHGDRQPLSDKNETDPGNLGESLDPVYQSVNP
ncbi:hypothetical protein CLF_107272 [Clonorchis sinensis]|uniref:Pol-related protein n=1 Tax=Clonorchis sinensis TaxID=79923 RepID=G7YGH1_CLOSI|nr:hypothetical protein CLF_107272 [Clonorchis sinensis]